ncbi:MAG: hypothetical protein HC882_00315 [Acidobacteria bacterium]|nr:hypothetical protein [Acidobacteriota bacterium]
MTQRSAVEGFLGNPALMSTAIGPRALAADCPSSDALYLAERAYIELLGPTPSINRVPGSSTPRRYLRVPPQASCPFPEGYAGGGGGGDDRASNSGGAGIAIAAAAGAAALFFFLR